MAGLELDPWQQWVLTEACTLKAETFTNPWTKRQHNMWAARDVGLVVARQNGKGSILEARELAGMFLFGEKTIIHSAQDFATSGEHFRRVASLIQDTPILSKELKGCYEANGKERIELKNGTRLLFKTRTKKLGRGFSPQLVVLDEAMFLDEEAMMALRPTLSAQPNYQLWYTGSAGMENPPAVEFGRVRNRAIKALDTGKIDPYLFFAEWSADACDDFCLHGCKEHDRLDDENTWARANPGYGIRISRDTVDNEYRAMSTDAFKIERLSVGVWPVEGNAWAILNEQSWNDQENPESQILMGGKKNIWTLAVSTSPTRKWSCITAAGINDEGMVHVEITGKGEGPYPEDYRQGTDWVVQRVKEIWNKRKPSAVVIDSAGQASSFIEELENLGITVISPKASEYAISCGEFHVGIVPRRGEVAKIVHIGQTGLTQAAAVADKRPLLDKWAWDQKNATSDISPLVSATIAAWGYRKLLNEQPASAPWVYRR
jgi:phage terminase large subunit-like protein